MGEIALSHFKIGARIKRVEKGTIIERDKTPIKKEQLLSEVKMVLLLYLKRGTHQGCKKALMRMVNGHLSTEMGHPSDFDRGILKS